MILFCRGFQVKKELNKGKLIKLVKHGKVNTFEPPCYYNSKTGVKILGAG